MYCKQPCVYLLASNPRATLYLGVTSNLKQRTWEHKQDFVEGFTRKYQVHSLVWFELHDSMYEAISREKNIKNWKRDWKINLIERQNPQWIDLYSSL